MANPPSRDQRNDDWAIEGRTSMVERQLAARGIRDERALRAMREVPREAFIPADLAEFAYVDAPLPIAEGQTISQPYIVALMVEALELKPEDRVLEIGTGSGYAAAVMARMVELIQHHGFTFVAAEADWPDAAAIDAYVRRSPDAPERPRQIFERFPTWMWRNLEVLEFVEWLRGHNDDATAAHRPTVGFYGHPFATVDV